MSALIKESIKKIESYVEDDIALSMLDIKKDIKKTKLLFSISIGLFSLIFVTSFYFRFFQGLTIKDEIVEYSSFLGIILMVIILMSGLSLYSKKNESEIKEYIKGKRIKEKSLTLNQIKGLNEAMLFIKNEITDLEFERVLLEIKKITGKDTDSAYFYLMLFENYEDILIKIKEKNLEENLLSLKYSLLTDKQKRKEQLEIVLKIKNFELKKSLNEMKKNLFFVLKSEKNEELEQLEKDRINFKKPPKNNIKHKVSFMFRNEEHSYLMLNFLIFLIIGCYFKLFFDISFGFMMGPLLLAIFIMFCFDFNKIKKDYKDEFARISANSEIVNKRIRDLKEDIISIRAGSYQLKGNERNYTLSKNMNKELEKYITNKESVSHSKNSKVFKSKNRNYQELLEFISLENNK